MKKLYLACVLAIGICTSAVAESFLFESIAGTGAPGNNGDSGPATAINIGFPFGVEIGPDGALYITEVKNHRIRRLDLTTNAITTVAGCGRRGYSGDSGLAVEAELDEPYECRFDSSGDMYFVEMKNHLIRRVDAETKQITTIAGVGRAGFDGDGGPATKALFNQPHSIALDRNDNLYVADIGNHRIRRIDAKTGVIETIAGNSQRTLPRDMQMARDNPILGPRALFMEGDTLWIALRDGQSIWRMNLKDGVLRHVAGTGKSGFTGDGGPAAAATFSGPKGIAVAKNRYVFVVDADNNAIRQIDLRSGEVTTVAPNDAQEGASASLNQPHGVCVTPDGELFIGDSLNNRVVRVRGLF